MKPGTKVTHAGRPGIIKRHSADRKSKRVFVVFNCGHQWEHYQDYPGEVCKLDELEIGWPEQNQAA